MSTEIFERYGATVPEWELAYSIAPTDLLPAVGDPTKIARRSEGLQHLESLAKTPSRIGSDGVCYGVGKWTAHISTDQMVRTWKADPALNTLLITRNIRAIDIDIDDEAIASQMHATICQRLGVQLPVRYRDNSGKRTLLVRLDPHTLIKKRVIHTPWGAIEFLADGQQTALFGTHSSGARFKHMHLDNGVPTVSQSAMAAVWDDLRGLYDQEAPGLIVEGERVGEMLIRNGGIIQNDPLLQYLHDDGWITGVESNGKVHVRCPNEKAHTTHSVGSTTYFPPGLGGVDKPGFSCLHSHCKHITPRLFQQLIGYSDKQIVDVFGQDLEPHPVAVVEQKLAALSADTKINDWDLISLSVNNGREILSTLNLDRNGKGVVKNNITNLVRIISAPQIVDAKFDMFAAQTVVRLGGVGAYRNISDKIVGMVRVMIEQMIDVKYSHDEINRQLTIVGSLNEYDSAIVWLSQQVWDGVPRIKNFARDILKTYDTPYTQALGEYLFAALAGRILSPGCKADISPVLVSPKQGTGKSSMVAALSPFSSWFGTVDLTDADDDVFRKIKGKNVVELPELRGLGGRDSSATKALLTQQVDQWVPKFVEQPIEVPRRCIFIGTDNRRRFLPDATGNRRWAPIRVAVSDEFVDWPAYEKERDQYYAEAAHLLKQGRSVEFVVDTYSTALRKLAGTAIANSMLYDSYYPQVKEFVDNQLPGTRVSLRAVFNKLFNGTNSMDRDRVQRIRHVMMTLHLEEVDADVWETPKIDFKL